jgi:hypothetical protein
MRKFDSLSEREILAARLTRSPLIKIDRRWVDLIKLSVNFCVEFCGDHLAGQQAARLATGLLCGLPFSTKEYWRICGPARGTAAGRVRYTFA